MNNPFEYKNGQYKTPLTYAVKHRDKRIRMASRSGGVFTALSDWIFQYGGVVYGCVLDDCYTAIHIRAENESDRDKMRGSKYIQSEMRDSFQQVKADLDAGRLVLFSGTSCQVAGLFSFLGKKNDRLFAVDIVCHGVPSPSVWKKYLFWQEKRFHSKILKVDFRNKKDFGWTKHVESLYMENGKQVNSRVFRNMFYGHTILRPSCYSCPYKDILHPGDITIADYWGIQKAAPNFDDNKGVSLALINNDKGKDLFEAVKEKVEYVETRIEDSLQPPLIAPFPKPSNREEFWNDLHEKEFSYIVKKYGSVSVSIILKRKIKKILNL